MAAYFNPSGASRSAFFPSTRPKISPSFVVLLSFLLWATSCSSTAGAGAHLPSSRNSKRELIVGGQDAEKGRYPYYVSLDYNNGVVLSGALIAPDVILTAGHCLENSNEELTIKVGTYSMSEDNSTDYDIVEIGTPILHPAFDRVQPESFRHDFLIFHLANSSSHQPVRINRDSAVPAINRTVVMMGLGWKTLAYWSPADTLQVANLTVFSNDDCAQSTDPARGLTYAGLIDETMMCTGVIPNNTRDGCAWDSGAPVIVPGRHSSHDILVGLGT